MVYILYLVGSPFTHGFFSQKKKKNVENVGRDNLKGTLRRSSAIKPLRRSGPPILSLYNCRPFDGSRHRISHAASKSGSSRPGSDGSRAQGQVDNISQS